MRISYSAFRMLLRCPFQFYCRYIEGKKIPPSGRAFAGGVVHYTLAQNFQHKLREGRDLPLPDLDDILTLVWEERLVRPEEEEEEEALEVDWRGDEPERLKEEARVLTRTYRIEVSPSLQPEEVERTRERELEDFLLLGKTDLELKDGPIVDYKTGAYPMRMETAVADNQATFYLLLKGSPGLFEYHSLSFSKSRGATISRLRTSRDQDTLFWFERTLLLPNLRMLVEFSRTGTFPPRFEPSNWWCSKKWCGYWDLCLKEVAKKFVID